MITCFGRDAAVFTRPTRFDNLSLNNEGGVLCAAACEATSFAAVANWAFFI
jgi:hypothetical protein